MSAIRLALAGRTHRAIGLMSGTSHDGIGAALVEINERVHPAAKLIGFHAYPYPNKLRHRLLEASAGGKVGAAELSELNFLLGYAFAQAAMDVARRVGMRRAHISFIGSHGHTFFHLPPRRAVKGQTPSTLQLGESAVIAAITGVPVVADFRPMDLVLLGEGAPLAPLAHLWMFAHPRLGRVVQNIGGIANATYIPAGARADRIDRRVFAFDTGPGAMIIDAIAAKLSHARFRMDRDGKMAARGRVNQALLAELMRNPYFRRRPPKSTGREEFGADYVARIEARARALGVGGIDLIATVTALTARSIAEAFRRFMIPRGGGDQLIATGGGAHNPTLMRMLREELKEVEVVTAAQLGVDGDALDAVAFAILAYQMLCGRPGNIPSVTGARSPAILGKLTLPPR
ncbi:MAG: anhydro-N-acetylmuramic acid kinase [Candidatus Binataceae bacterium]